MTHQKVQFRNRFGIVLAGDLYRPKNPGNGKLPALVLSGPFGAVKEQSSGLYAQTLAERGVTAEVRLTHRAEVKVTHLGEYGGFLSRPDVDPGASSGDSGSETTRPLDPADCERDGAIA